MSKTTEQINTFTCDFIARCFEHPVGMETDLPREDRAEMANILAGALDAVVASAAGRAKWERSCHFECQGIPTARAETNMENTGARCGLILYGGEVTLQLSLPHPLEIPSMDNEFWHLLTTSVVEHHLKYAAYQDMEAIKSNPENKKLTRFTKSATFAFLTEFLIGYQHHPYFLNLGKFEKSVCFHESDWHSIIDQFSPIVSDFSKLSQALYRSHYIKTASKRRSKN